MFLLLLLLISFSFYFVFLTWCLRLHARVLRRPFCVDSGNSMCFSYWKNVRLKLKFPRFPGNVCDMFQLLLKECTIEANWPFLRCAEDLRVSVVIERMYDWSFSPRLRAEWRRVSVVIERMYDWSIPMTRPMFSPIGFSCYWKNVRLKRPGQVISLLQAEVSVVIERMYDWSLFSKIWGDCLTVFDSCGNIWLHSFNNEIALGRAEINLIKY